jgi:D-serine dehydratase
MAGTLSGLDKGVPGGAAPGGWNVLREDLPLPVCVLRESALERNARRMQRFTEQTGALLSPHGKTTMSPQLFERQLGLGAWGITLATGHQLQVARRHGIGRILYANQLVGAAEIRFACEQLRADPAFDLLSLVDSVAGVELLAERVAAHAPGRPLRVLLECGFAGGRCGVRSVDEALAVAAAVGAAGPRLELAGVEGFEGLLGDEPAVRGFLGFMAETARALDGRFTAPEVLLTAGGSAYYDLVAGVLGAVRLSRPTRLVLRPGCYLTHDHGLYAGKLEALRRRTGDAADLAFEPALEVWAQVLSTPEPELVILSAGRRDFGQDAGDPVPFLHAPRGAGAARELGGCEIAAVSDQHAHVRAPRGHALAVGDLVALGPSHPCTTFDKWRVIHLVDDGYDVVDSIRTFF